MHKRIKKMIPKDFKRSLKSIKNRQKYKEIIEEKFTKTSSPKFVLLGTPNSTNLGDHAIAEAEKQFITDYYPNYDYVEITLLNYYYGLRAIKKFITNDDVILIHGGGFLGNLWIEAEYMVRDIIKNFPNNKLIIMPQTIFFDDRYNKEKELKNSQKSYNSHSNLIIFLREKNSYEFVLKNFETSVNPKLVPDIVTYLNYHSDNISREGALMCFRNDKEKLNHSTMVKKIEGILNKKNQKIDYTDTVIEEDVNESNRRVHLEKKFKEFNSRKLVVTDRLHGMVFSLITGTPCIAFNNSSGKVRGVYEWIKDCGYIICLEDDMDESEVEALVTDLLNYTSYGYDNSLVTHRFESLLQELSKIKS